MEGGEGDRAIPDEIEEGNVDPDIPEMPKEVDAEPDNAAKTKFMSRTEYEKKKKEEAQRANAVADPFLPVIDKNMAKFLIPFDLLPVKIGFYADPEEGETKFMARFMKKTGSYRRTQVGNYYPWNLRKAENFSPGHCKCTPDCLV